MCGANRARRVGRGAGATRPHRCSDSVGLRRSAARPTRQSRGRPGRPRNSRRAAPAIRPGRPNSSRCRPARGPGRPAARRTADRRGTGPRPAAPPAPPAARSAAVRRRRSAWRSIARRGASWPRRATAARRTRGPSVGAICRLMRSWSKRMTANGSRSSRAAARPGRRRGRSSAVGIAADLGYGCARIGAGT